MALRALTRAECESEILKRCEAINKIYKRYNPDGAYLSIGIIDGRVSVNNEYWGADSGAPLNAYTHREDVQNA